MIARAATLLVKLFIAGVLFLAGLYTLVYLARWEWNRAIISGLFFVAAEVIVVGLAILRRLHRIEERLASAPPGAVDPAAEERALVHLRTADVDRPNPFAWLGPDRTAVFVPILLGAGVIMSAVAYVVERVARSTAVPAMDRRLARRLATIAPPATLLTGEAAPAAAPAAERPGSSRRATGWWAAGAVVLAAATWAGIDALGDATQTRPGGARPAVSVLELEVHQPGPDVRREPVVAADLLWSGCRSTLRARAATDASLTPTGPGTVVLRLVPGINGMETRRFVGCLQDAAVDRIQGRVLTIRHEGP
jgi:hypothetical protein